MRHELIEQRSGLANTLHHALPSLIMVPVPAAKDIDALAGDAIDRQSATPGDEGETTAGAHQFEHNRRRSFIIAGLDHGIGAVTTGQ